MRAACTRRATLAERHRERPYDAVVHQMGNGTAHAFLYDLLPRVPGLLVLHDLVLHHSRARDVPRRAGGARVRGGPRRRARCATRRRGPLDGYRRRARLRLSRRRPSALRGGAAGHRRATCCPTRIRSSACRSRRRASVAVHNAFMADAVRAEVPDARRRARGHADRRRRTSRPSACAALRARLGLADGRAASWALRPADPREADRHGGARGRARARARCRRLRAAARRARARPARARRGARRARARAARRSSPAACRSRSCPRTWRRPTSSCTCATRPRARPRPRCCACSPRAGRRSCPTSSTWRDIPDDAVVRADLDRRGGRGHARAAAARGVARAARAPRRAGPRARRVRPQPGALPRDVRGRDRADRAACRCRPRGPGPRTGRAPRA